MNKPLWVFHYEYMIARMLYKMWLSVVDKDFEDAMNFHFEYLFFRDQIYELLISMSDEELDEWRTMYIATNCVVNA